MAGRQPLTFVTKISVLDFAVVLDTPLIKFYARINIDSVKFHTCLNLFQFVKQVFFEIRCT